MAEVRVPAGDVAVLFGLPVTSTLCCTAGRSNRAVSRLLEPPRAPSEGEVHHLEACTGILHLADRPADKTHPRPGGLHAEWPVA
jgi:hypothetical protein